MTEILEKFLGLWKDEHGNIIYIQVRDTNEVKASFASGKTEAPFVRRCFRNELTIDMPGEFIKDFGALAIRFGKPYRGPELHLTYIQDEENKTCYLEPAYVCIVSATEAEEECLEQIKSVEDLHWIEQEEWKFYLTRYKLLQK